MCFSLELITATRLGARQRLLPFEAMESQAVHDHVFRLGDKMRSGPKGIVNRLGIRPTVAGFGSVFLTYFMEGPIENYSDLLRNDQQLMVTYRRRLIERGIFKLPLNFKRNHISFSHTDQHVGRTLQVADDVLKEICKAPTRTASASN
jgi:glutamate-1-semialdehyde 2,1-aminomutase